MTDPEDWDTGAELAARTAHAEVLAAYDEAMRAIPYPRFRAKGCGEGAHHMVRDAGGARCWQCVRCQVRQPFNINGSE